MVECLLCTQEVGRSIPKPVLYFQSWLRMFSSCQACRITRVRLGAFWICFYISIYFYETQKYGANLICSAYASNFLFFATTNI